MVTADDRQAFIEAGRRVATPLRFALEASRGRWQSAPHLRYIDERISRAVKGRSGTRILLLEAPPRHGKSEYASHWLPAWFLGAYPDKRVLLGSYSDAFARNWGRKARETLERHGPTLFGVKVSRKSYAANEWTIAGRDGGMATAGVGGSFTGRGADLLLVDDPIKNAEEAISDNLREKQWEWWQSTAWTRLEPGGIAVVIMTRWHEDDLIGRLVRWAADESLPLEHISFPAIALDDDPLGRAPGEALWPERLPIEEIELRQRMLDAYWFSCLYQQRPGTYGKNEWPADYFSGVEVAPEDWPDAFESCVIALDPSKGKSARKGDFSGLVWIGSAKGLLWVAADVERRPVPTMVSDGIRFAYSEGCDHFGVESNAFQDLLEGEFDRACEDAGVPPLPIALINNHANKELRISRLGPWLARRKFRFRRDPKTRRLLEQLKAFPFGEHDDGPDAMEMALRLLRWSARNSVEDGAPEEVLRV